jgi:hypothetical protein
MHTNPDGSVVLRISLEDWEWDMLDAIAAAEGKDRQTMMREIFMEQAKRELNDMYALSSAKDRQCKSHKLN